MKRGKHFYTDPVILGFGIPFIIVGIIITALGGW